jgi:hypothetical protein
MFESFLLAVCLSTTARMSNSHEKVTHMVRCISEGKEGLETSVSKTGLEHFVSVKFRWKQLLSGVV